MNENKEITVAKISHYFSKLRASVPENLKQEIDNQKIAILNLIEKN